MPEPISPPKSPELVSLEVTRDSLRASIAARESTGNQEAGFARGTQSERDRLREVEARISEISKPSK